MRRLILLAAFCLLAASASAQYFYAPRFVGGEFTYRQTFGPPAYSWTGYGAYGGMSTYEWESLNEARRIRWALEDAAFERRWRRPWR